MNQYIPEVSFRMMPTEEVSVAYRKHLLVYDNLDGKSKCINFSESIFPLKLQFTLVTICCEGEVQISANLEDYTLHPGDIDILVTHWPPYGILDNDLGSPDILNFVLKAQPKWHLFGHIHETEGQQFQLGRTICQNISVFNAIS